MTMAKGEVQVVNSFGLSADQIDNDSEEDLGQEDLLEQELEDDDAKSENSNDVITNSHSGSAAPPAVNNYGQKIACINCRRSKVRCEGGIPCRRCLRMGFETTCKQCEPKKKGRKRKSEAEAERKMQSLSSSLHACMDEAGHKRMKLHDEAEGISEGPAQSEVDATDRFAALANQFQKWKQSLGSLNGDMSAVTPSVNVMRFLWYCSYISYLTKEHLSRFLEEDVVTVKQENGSTAAVESKSLASVWLCSNLAKAVNAVVATVNPNVLALFAQLHTVSSTDMLQINVQKQVYKMLPLGVAVVQLHPSPRVPTHKCWANQRLANLLGYKRDEMNSLFTQGFVFPSAVHRSSIPLLTELFSQTIMKGESSFACTTKWVNKSGETVDLTGTFAVQYYCGSQLPVAITMFLQASTPVTLHRAMFSPSVDDLAAQADEMDGDNMRTLLSDTVKRIHERRLHPLHDDLTVSVDPSLFSEQYSGSTCATPTFGSFEASSSKEVPLVVTGPAYFGPQLDLTAGSDMGISEGVPPTPMYRIATGDLTTADLTSDSKSALHSDLSSSYQLLSAAVPASPSGFGGFDDLRAPVRSSFSAVTASSRACASAQNSPFPSMVTAPMYSHVAGFGS